MVTEVPTMVVSVDNRLINSPVLTLSKNAISCRMIDLKITSRRFFMILLPGLGENKNQTCKSAAMKLKHKVI